MCETYPYALVDACPIWPPGDARCYDLVASGVASGALDAGRVGDCPELPNAGSPFSGGTERKSPCVSTIGLTNPGGPAASRRAAAAWMRVRKRSNERRRSMKEDWSGSPDAASSASFETTKLTRRTPSRISKRMALSANFSPALEIVVTGDAFPSSRTLSRVP